MNKKLLDSIYLVMSDCPNYSSIHSIISKQELHDMMMKPENMLEFLSLFANAIGIDDESDCNTKCGIDCSECGDITESDCIHVILNNIRNNINKPRQQRGPTVIVTPTKYYCKGCTYFVLSQRYKCDSYNNNKTSYWLTQCAFNCLKTISELSDNPETPSWCKYLKEEVEDKSQICKYLDTERQTCLNAQITNFGTSCPWGDGYKLHPGFMCPSSSK